MQFSSRGSTQRQWNGIGLYLPLQRRGRQLKRNSRPFELFASLYVRQAITKLTRFVFDQWLHKPLLLAVFY
jgi:hypothetical protein